MQKIELPYELKDNNPIQITFLSHEPLNLKKKAIISGNKYTVDKIERTIVMKSNDFTMFVTTSFPSKNQSKMFCVKDMQDVFESLGLEFGNNEMFLHTVNEI
jgi:hypothetical protein